MENKPKPWLKLPGECVDSRGVPIYPGDLLRTFHFTGTRRKKYWLYHVAVLQRMPDGHEYLRMVPTAELEPTLAGRGGSPLLSDDLAAACEVISGHGPGDYLDFDDRPKRKGANQLLTRS